VELMNCMVAGCNSVKSTITKACDPTHHKGPTHCQAICARKVVVQVFGIIGTGLRCYTTGGVCVCVCQNQAGVNICVLQVMFGNSLPCLSCV